MPFPRVSDYTSTDRDSRLDVSVTLANVPRYLRKLAKPVLVGQVMRLLN